MISLFKKRKPGQEEAHISAEFAVKAHARDLTDRLFADFSPIYFGPQNPKKDGGAPEDQKYDGLVQTSMGYYRLFEDSRNGNRVLLSSHSPEALVPEKADNGQWRLVDPDKIYVVDAVNKSSVFGRAKGPAAHGSEMREAMARNDRMIRDLSLDYLNLYAADLTHLVPQKDPENPRRIVKLANGQMAYGIFEEESGQWSVRIYVANERVGNKDFDHFMAIDEAAPSNVLKKFLSLGQKKGKFDSFSDAYRFVFEDWAKMETQDKPSRAYRMWSGRSPLKPADKIKDPIKTFVRQTYVMAQDINRWKLHRPLMAAAVVTATTAIPQLRYGRFLVGGLAVAAASAGAMLDAMMAESLVKMWSKLDRWKQKRLAKFSMKAAREEARRSYMEDTGANMSRLFPKVSGEVLPFLTPLSQVESCMQYDDKVFAPYSEIGDEDHWMASVQNRLYASIFTPMNHDIATLQAPNGLTGFFHVSADNRTKTAYLGYRPDWEFDEAFHIPEDVLDEIKEHGIVKVVHRKGKPSPKHEKLSYGQFAQEVRQLIEHSDGQNPVSVDSSLKHVHSLFNECAGVNSDYTRYPKSVIEDLPEIKTPYGEYSVPETAVPVAPEPANDNDAAEEEPVLPLEIQEENHAAAVMEVSMR